MKKDTAVTGLSPEMKRLLKGKAEERSKCIWTPEEVTKLQEAIKECGSTPSEIHSANLFPNKSYAQIREKYYKVK